MAKLTYKKLQTSIEEISPYYRVTGLTWKTGSGHVQPRYEIGAKGENVTVNLAETTNTVNGVEYTHEIQITLQDLIDNYLNMMQNIKLIAPASTLEPGVPSRYPLWISTRASDSYISYYDDEQRETEAFSYSDGTIYTPASKAAVSDDTITFGDSVTASGSSISLQQIKKEKQTSMATVVSTLYPPQVETFMPAFPYNEVVRVYFSVSVFDSVKDIKRVHVSVVDQKTNQNALAAPLGILFYDFSTQGATTDSKYIIGVDKETSRYYIDISPKMLKSSASEGTNETTTWIRNQYYKIQLRFDTFSDTVKTSSYNTTNTEDAVGAAQKLSYINTNTQYFSEWSTVCLIRPISIPNMYITTSDFVDWEEEAPAFNRGLITIAGRLEFNYLVDGKNGEELAVSQVETDKLKSFTATITNRSAKEDIWTSEIFYTQDNVDPNSFSEKINLKEATSKADVDASDDGGGVYGLRLDYVTVNGYSGSSVTYAFDLTDYININDFQPEAWYLVDNEEGKVCLRVENNIQMPANGAVFISRTSNLSEFKDWEIIYASRVSDLSSASTDKLVVYYEDKTVGSYIWYQYQVQYRTNAGAFSRAFVFKDWDEWQDGVDQTIAFPNFYDAFLSRMGQQLDIRYDFSVSSLKQNVSRAKIETLGGKYPKFAENAVLRYKQFSISGLISAEADANQVFLDKSKYFVATDGTNSDELYQAYLKEEGIGSQRRNDFLPSSLEITEDSVGSINRQKVYNNEAGAYVSGLTVPPYHTTTEYDYLWEREFRENALNWLNDGEPKLFRSMTEGLMPVMLMDVSLTPNKTLGRMVYSFTATAYEIGDGHSVENLDALGIINIPGVGDDDIDADVPHKNYLDMRLIGQQYNPVISAANQQVKNPDIVTYYAANKIQDRYQGVRGNLKPVITDGLIYLNDLKIQFTTMPHSYWTTQDSHGIINTYVDRGWTEGHDPRDARLGYRFRLDSYGKEQLDLKEILINSRGYYQLPSAASAYRLKLCEVDKIDGNKIVQGDRAVFDYIINYKLINARQEIRKVTIKKTIIGQYSDLFYPDVAYGPVFRAKYTFVKTNDTAISSADRNNSTAVGDKSVFASNNIDSYQYMDHFKGVCLDVTPYSVIKIKWYTEDEYETVMIGATGILHILGDAPIEDIQFVGRRLSLYTPTTYDSDGERPYGAGYRKRNSRNYLNREPQLKEYQFCWDESCKKNNYFNVGEKRWLVVDSGEQGYNPVTDKTRTSYVVQTHNGGTSGIHGTDIYSTETSTIPHYTTDNTQSEFCTVTIVGQNDGGEEGPDESKKVFSSRSIISKWRNFDDYISQDGQTGYIYFGAIKDPQINHIYRVRGQKYIYYIDGNWYPVVGYTEEYNEDGTEKLPSQVIVATPSEGHVDFKGQILKAYYAPYTEELEG